MNKTAIDYTDLTWNPVTGFTKGCTYCYACGIAKRFGRDFRPRMHPGRLVEPLLRKQPSKIFMSMGDLFDPLVSPKFIEAVFGIMAITPHHTYQVLTKRPDRAQEWLNSTRHGQCVAEITERLGALAVKKRTFNRVSEQIGAGWPWPLPNVWMGTTVEHQAAVDERIPYLLKVPAAVRWLSCEPLLGPLNIGSYLWYNPPYEYSTAGSQSLSSGGSRGLGDRRMRKGLEDQNPPDQQVDQKGSSNCGASTASRELHGTGLFTGEADGRQGQNARSSSQVGMASLFRPDTKRNDDQSQEWTQRRQQAREPRTSNDQGTNNSRYPYAEDNESRQPAGREPLQTEVHKRPDSGDSQAVERGRINSAADSRNLLRQSDHYLGNRIEKDLVTSAINWVVIGQETGNRKGKVTPEREWIEQIVSQCQAASVPVFMKKNLKTVWGDPLIQEYPKGA